MNGPESGGDTGAALLALLILLGWRAVDWIAPKGWHLRIVRRYGERDKEDTDGDGT